jgi:hypothetical protein
VETYVILKYGLLYCTSLCSAGLCNTAVYCRSEAYTVAYLYSHIVTRALQLFEIAACTSLVPNALHCYTVYNLCTIGLKRTLLSIHLLQRTTSCVLNQRTMRYTTILCVHCYDAGLKRTLRDRRVQQEASLTSLHRVVEGRSAQLSRQEARIRQRDDIMARTTVSHSLCDLFA